MLPTEDIEATGQPSQGEQDLGPLAWVLEELRKSLDASVKATRRFVREAQEARDSDLAALDVSPLRMAKQQLHQSSGALEMVGMPQAALLLRAMETALQHFVQNPADCTEAVVQTLEKASFALLEYLEAVLAGQRISAVALFPQYRDVQGLYGNAGKVHPADLWPVERRLREPDIARTVEPLGYGAAQRAVLDAAVLQMVKGQDMAAAMSKARTWRPPARASARCVWVLRKRRPNRPCVFSGKWRRGISMPWRMDCCPLISTPSGWLRGC